MADHDLVVSVDDRLIERAAPLLPRREALKLVIAELKSVAYILEDLAVMLREAPEGLCSASATARLNQYPSNERFQELVQEARDLRMDLQDLEREIPKELAG